MSILKSKHSGWTWDLKRTPFGDGGGGGGPSQPTSQTVNNSNIPDYARPYVETMLGTTQQQLYNYDKDNNVIGLKAYQPYSTNPKDYVAGFSPLQQMSQQGVANLSMPGQYQQGSEMVTGAGAGGFKTANEAGGYGAQGVQAGQQSANLSNMYGGAGANIGMGFGQQATDPNAVQAYMNPYLQSALQPQLQEIGRQYDITGTQEMSNATRSGAFGGNREALMAAENQRNKNTAMNQVIGQGYNQAFNNAQQQMGNAAQFGMQGANIGLQGAGQAGAQTMQGLGMGLQGVGAQQAGYGLAGQQGASLANIGGQQLQSQQGILAAQGAAGNQQQAQQQQILNNAINNYAQAQQYPQQQLAFMNAQLRGLPLQTTTSSNYQAAPSAVSQAAGLGTAGIAGLGLYNAMSRP